MTKVHIDPWYDKPDKADGGIRRVVEAQIKHLEKFGVKPVKNVNEADVIANHGASLTERPLIPSVNHGHGFYWSRYEWGNVYHETNLGVIKSMKHAVAHTAPSEWVAVAMRRGMLAYPEVIYHGVDIEDWNVIPKNENKGYVLWNKARADVVSNPQDMNSVASLLLNRPFVSTVGAKANNVKITGPMPYGEMKHYIEHAGVYLATARETFGIGTLEALASGIPVAGWDWGGQSEIIVHGVTGYLAPPGDFKALADCIEACYEHRDRLSENAREDVEKRWGWEHRIEQYANLYKGVHKRYSEKKPKVSVVLTAYNLDKYLPDAIRSTQAQDLTDWELLVIDDAQSVTTKEIVDSFSTQDKRISYLPTPENLGLSGARNFGVVNARSEYIRLLDADDLLATNALSLEANELDQNWGTHIAYGHLEQIQEDGSQFFNKAGDVIRSDWPPPHYSWNEQMAHLNQPPSCAMIRKRVFEAVGGYRERMWRNEDAEFWCRATSLGFEARKFTQAVTYLHRHRTDSKGESEWRDHGQEPDWTAWFPWRMGAGTYQEGHEVIRQYGNDHPARFLVPFGAQGAPTDLKKAWMVNDYSYPVVSVIVTVGPGHEGYLIDALDSVLAQTYPDWECIVVNDTGKPWDKHINGCPWAKVVSTGGQLGTSRARNVGYEHAKGQLIAYLDADDYWLPWFLQKTISMYEEHDGVIFTDFIENKQGQMKLVAGQEFECGRVIKGMGYAGSSILIPRWVHEKIIEGQGGWDEDIYGMEDWDYQIAIQAFAGACSYRVPEPLFVYRFHTTTKRERDYAKIDEIVNYVDNKWKEYRQGEKKLMCGCRNKHAQKANTNPSSMMSSSGNFTQESLQKATEDTGVEGSAVLVEYSGERKESFWVRGKGTGRRYKFGRDGHNERKMVWAEDVPGFLESGPGIKSDYAVVEKQHATPNVSNPAAFLGEAIVGG